ncbi:hypothetical protein EZS27_023445 [termite gut metagenome]|uniref:Uncharacterized protein n=1 Tax=termite gut metagenome TaxID=433724 RepID=A0A5J4R0G0_9ZZZZ
MNELSKTRLFSLLAEPSQEVTKEEMQNAYGHFVKQVETLSQSETDYSIILRALNLTRIEFSSLESIFWCGQGEKCT